jgi:hypothetical protein
MKPVLLTFAVLMSLLAFSEISIAKEWRLCTIGRIHHHRGVTSCVPGCMACAGKCGDVCPPPKKHHK